MLPPPSPLHIQLQINSRSSLYVTTPLPPPHTVTDQQQIKPVCYHPPPPSTYSYRSTADQACMLPPPSQSPLPPPHTVTDHKLEEVLIHPKSQQSRNRWLVAYTLIRNPSLQPLTASNIAREKRAELTTPLSEETSVVGTNSEHEVQRQRGLIVTFN